MASTVLWGRDHVALGEVVARSVGTTAGLALSRGLHPKAYEAVEPNEDVVAVLTAAGRRLAVVADGHHGAAAAEAAVGALLERCDGLPPAPGLSLVEVVELLAVADAAASAKGGGSRTTLSVAWLEGTQLQWTSFGDSAVLLSSAGGRRLTTDRHLFLGEGWSRPELAARASSGTGSLEPGTDVALVTDGFTNFVTPAGRPEACVAEEAAGSPGVADLAERLVRRACRDGAGDNVAVAVLRADGG